MKFTLTFLINLSLLLNSTLSQDASQPTELRGVWLTNVDSQVLDSREGIREAMQFLADHNFNVVFPVVWNAARTIYASQVMDSIFGIRIDERFAGRDPLAEVIEEAHQRNIAVIPWFEYGFAAAHQKKPRTIFKLKPHWAARDNRGKILTKNGFQWMNPFHPEVQEFMLKLVKEVVTKYDVDGIQGDDRLPALPIEGDYSRYTDSLYRAEHDGQRPPKNFRDPDWQRWRADKLNAFGRRLYHEVKALKPGLIVSWAPSIYPWSYDEYLQDWPSWLSGGYADLVIPQCYRYELPAYRSTLDEIIPNFLKISPSDKIIFPGVLMNVGDYVMSEDYLLKVIEYNRLKGYQGEVFFFYEGLRKNNDRLAKALLKHFYQTPAKLPWL
ncbi:MAG: family 10 glycosylhydrolase [candidate division KSB1 bacterium]|nr:family 10 glycosylhydrolase [candidate division KSB1 bacterium]